MITKANLKQQIELLPEKFSIDELVERMILIEKIETGVEQSKKGETVSESELEEEMIKWFK